MKAMKKIFDFEGMIESGAQARKINAVGMTMKGQIDEILTNRSLDFEGIHFVPKVESWLMSWARVLREINIHY